MSPGTFRRLLGGMMARSFLVQASWSFRGMQNLGFAAMTIPALRALDREKGRNTPPGEMSVQAEFFNTHPYLAGAVAGIASNLKDGSADSPSFIRAGREARETFMGPLGALGDDFFWATLRPLAGCLGVILTMAGKPLLGLGAFLALYNYYHLRIRWESLRQGLRGSEALIAWLGRKDFHTMSRATRRASAALFMLLPLAWTGWDANPWRNHSFPATVALTFGVTAALALLQRKMDPRRTVLLVLAFSVVLASTGGRP